VELVGGEVKFCAMLIFAVDKNKLPVLAALMSIKRVTKPLLSWHSLMYE
jgi:hypothetical protein